MLTKTRPMSPLSTEWVLDLTRYSIWSGKWLAKHGPNPWKMTLAVPPKTKRELMSAMGRKQTSELNSSAPSVDFDDCTILCEGVTKEG